MQKVTTNEQHKVIAEKSNAKYFILGAIILLVLHMLSGYLQVPQKVIEVGLSKGFETSHLKFGYTLGIFLIYAIPVPIIFTLFSLLSKKRRNSLSISKVIFWSLLTTLFFNFLMGFVLAPNVVLLP